MTKTQRHGKVIQLDNQARKTSELGDALAVIYEDMTPAEIRADIRDALAKKADVDMSVGARESKEVKAIFDRATYLYGFIAGDRTDGNAKGETKDKTPTEIAQQLISKYGKAKANRIAKAVISS